MKYLLLCLFLTAAPLAAQHAPRFELLSVFDVRLNEKQASAAEIVVATPDGKGLISADSLGHGIGFVDITNPKTPRADGYIELKGEPTSVAVTGPWGVVVTDDSDFKGTLYVIDLRTRETVGVHPLEGKPDCLAAGPDGHYLAVCLENEAKNGFPEAPPGAVRIFDLVSNPNEWTTRLVPLTGLDCFETGDPEPEYLSIDAQNRAAITLQENNCVVILELSSGKILHQFTAGTSDLREVDLREDTRVEMVDSRDGVPREPDGVDWCSLGIVTANEGDLRGGTRSFSIFSERGELLYDSGPETEHVARDMGCYPDNRSEDRGTEPESVKVASFNGLEYILVGCERSNLVLVYTLKEGKPGFLQALPSGPGPESVATIPERNLLVVGSEVDDPQHDLRSRLFLYRLSN